MPTGDQAHNACAVANQFIEKANNDGGAFTPLQIIKLVYIAHGWMLGLYNRRLFRQPVLAWLYGPVVRDVYRELRRYRSDGVTKKIDAEEENFDEYEVDLIDQVYEKYGHFSGMSLSRMTHAKETPWHQIWHGQGQNSVIPNDLIREHYAMKARQNSAHDAAN